MTCAKNAMSSHDVKSPSSLPWPRNRGLEDLSKETLLMAAPGADQNLLFGILALQMDFITPDALISAMHGWVLDKKKTLGEILQRRGDLAEDERLLLEAMVRMHLEKHGSSATNSLASVGQVGRIVAELRAIADTDLETTLDRLPSQAKTEPDDDATDPNSARRSRSGNERYQILRFHARGGLGEVYVAKDHEVHREVALKQLQDHLADRPEFQARFLLEAEVTGSLEHKGVVPVYGMGRFEDDRPFYAMRLVSGTSLKDEIDGYHAERTKRGAGAGRSLDLSRLLSRFVDVCQTIAYAHSRGVWHRDLKPSNIMLDRYGETLVLDWGLAKPAGSRDLAGGSDELTFHPAQDTPATQPGSRAGTPAYMSPEQADGRVEEVGPASDIYSLGATLYCLLTGMAPFDGSDPAAILAKVSAGDFARPREVDSTIPRPLEAICMKAMALGSPERYQSTRALAEDVERWLADLPVAAYPEPPGQRASRWIRHHKQWVSAIAAMLVLGALGLLIHSIRLSREQTRTADQLVVTLRTLAVLLDTAGTKLAEFPDSEKMREELAELVQVHCRSLAEKFPYHPDIQFATAQDNYVIGGIGRITGQFEKSLKSYNLAIDVFSALSQADPANTKYHRMSAESLIDRGELHHLYGSADNAIRDMESALTRIEPLQSVSADFRRTKAKALINLSELHLLRDEPDKAARRATEAVTLLEILVAVAPSGPMVDFDRWLLSMALADRASAAAESGELESTLADFGTAEEVALQIKDEDVLNDAHFQVALISNQRADALRKEPSRQVQVANDYAQAARILEPLIKNYKYRPQYREEMAVSLTGSARLHLERQRPAQADRDIHSALDLLDKLIDEHARKGAPESAQYLSLQGRALFVASMLQASQGMSDEAEATRAKAIARIERSLEIDPARQRDRETLKAMRAGRETAPLPVPG
jgi:serine/threonine-protein kinase